MFRRMMVAACAVAMLALPATADASGLTIGQAKKATKKVALKYQAGEGVQVTKLSCKRTSPTKATCKFELMAPERCKGTVKVTKRGSKVKAVQSGRTLCEVYNPDGTIGWG